MSSKAHNRKDQRFRMILDKAEGFKWQFNILMCRVTL